MFTIAQIYCIFRSSRHAFFSSDVLIACKNLTKGYYDHIYYAGMSQVDRKVQRKGRKCQGKWMHTMLDTLILLDHLTFVAADGCV